MTEYISYNRNSTKCALNFCTSTNARTAEGSQLTFHSFPDDPVRCAIWIKNCNSKYLPSVTIENLKLKYKLCSLHFEDRMFNLQKNRLLSIAVPTLFKNNLPVITSVASQQVYETIIMDDDVPPAIPIDVQNFCTEYDVCINQILFGVPISTELLQNSVSLQTPNDLSAKSPQKLELEKQLAEEIKLKKQLEKTVIKLKTQLEQTNSQENFLKLCEMYLPSKMYMLVKKYLSNKNRKPNGQRHLNEIIKFAQTIYRLGPKAYNFLQNRFTLPHVRTLKRKQFKKKYSLRPQI